MLITEKDVSFLREGEGEDLVLLHGYLSSKEAFLPLLEYFSRSYRVTAIDFCGFGKSAPLPYAFSVADYAEWTNGVFSLLGVERPLCIAHSFGCRVAVKMQSELFVAGGFCGFKKLLLTGPAGILTKKTAAYHAKVKAYRFVKRFFPSFAERRFGSAEYRTLSPVMKESYKKIVGEDLRGDIKNTACPAMIVEGTRDSVTTAAEAEEYAALLPNGALRYIEGGHFAFCDDFTEFCMIAEDFFSNE